MLLLRSIISRISFIIIRYEYDWKLIQCTLIVVIFILDIIKLAKITICIDKK